MGIVPTQLSAGNLAQSPVNVGGVLLDQRPFFALASFQTASGGMPAPVRAIPSGGATPTGVLSHAAFPGFGASYVGTGMYNITFPPFQNGTILPEVSAPSGFNMIANFLQNRGDVASGVSVLQITRSGTGPAVPINPPTGTRIDLLFLAAPRNSQNITRF